MSDRVELAKRLRDVANSFACGDYTAMDLEDNEIPIHKLLHETADELDRASAGEGGAGSRGHDPVSFNRGIRAAVQWLHLRAASMNDQRATTVLNSAATNLGWDNSRGGISFGITPVTKRKVKK